MLSFQTQDSGRHLCLHLQGRVLHTRERPPSKLCEGTRWQEGQSGRNLEEPHTAQTRTLTLQRPTQHRPWHSGNPWVSPVRNARGPDDELPCLSYPYPLTTHSVPLAGVSGDCFQLWGTCGSGPGGSLLGCSGLDLSPSWAQE